MKNKSLKLVLCVLATLAYTASYEQVQFNYSGQDHETKYNIKEGRITGNYLSKYTNDKIKAEGTLVNGYKEGIWNFYDSTGTLQLQRDYSSPFEYTNVVPKTSAAKPSSYSTVYNENGYVSSFEIDQKNVVWNKRLWRNLDSKNNSVIFNENRLYKLFCSLADEGEIKVYGVTNDEFTEEVAYNSDQYEKHSPIRYRIKEESFFETERMVMETRIIGICPVVEIEGKETDLFWIYFPEARPHLAKELVHRNLSERVKTLDDLFLFRDFASNITMESNSKYRPITAYKQGNAIQKEEERIEMLILNKEIDLLIESSL